MLKSAIKSKKFKKIALTKSKMNDIIYTVKGGEMMDDIKKAIRKCGNVVHAEALAAIVESLAGQRLEATL